MLRLCEIRPEEQMWRSLEGVFRHFAELNVEQDEYQQMLDDLPDESNHRNSDNEGVNEVAVPPSFWAVRDGHGVGGTRRSRVLVERRLREPRGIRTTMTRSGRSGMNLAVGHRKQ
jgi:hypothetical protein